MRDSRINYNYDPEDGLFLTNKENTLVVQVINKTNLYYKVIWSKDDKIQIDSIIKHNAINPFGNMTEIDKEDRYIKAMYISYLFRKLEQLKSAFQDIETKLSLYSQLDTLGSINKRMSSEWRIAIENKITEVNKELQEYI